MRIVSVTLILLVSCSPQARAQRPGLTHVLAAPVTTFHIRATNLLQAAAQISSRFDVPIGIAWRGDVNAGRRISKDWSDTTVANLLRDVVAEDPEYELDISNGVVHIQPTALENGSLDFLNIKLPSFTATDYTHVVGLQLRDQLNRILIPRPAEPKAQTCGGSLGIGAQEVHTTIALVNASVRQVLDALLLNSRYQMWLVIFNPNTTYNGYFGTASIFRKTSDWDQPNWDFLSRYFDPIERRERRDWSGDR